MNEQDELLYSSGYFKCERTHCRLSIEACLKRQVVNEDKGWAVHLACQGCPQGKKNRKKAEKKVRMTQEKQVKKCQRCGDKPTMHPNSKYCGSCLAKFPRDKPRTKRAPGERKPKIKDRGKAETRKPDIEGLEALMKLFCDYPKMLDEIRKLAKEETRPFEYQVIALLKEGLNSRK